MHRGVSKRGSWLLNGKSQRLIYLTQQANGWGRKGFYGRMNGFFRKDKWVFRRPNRDKKVRDNVCLYRYKQSFYLLRAIKLLWRRNLGQMLFTFFLLGVNPSQRRNLWQPYFPDTASFSMIWQAPRRLLSASVDAQMS